MLNNRCISKILVFCYLFCALNFPVNAEKEPVDDSAPQVEPSSTMLNLEQTTLQGFLHGFIATFSVIIVSEIGDKTFFIAAIMAMKHSRLTVFLGAISALTAMTIISVLFGWVATIIPQVYTYYISTALFAIFGLKMLWEGYHMSSTEAQEEIEEVQSDLRKREDEANARAASSQPVNVEESPQIEVLKEVDIENPEGSAKETTEVESTQVENMKIEKESIATDVETGGKRKRQSILKAVSRIFLQAFTLTFLAEWGDRSQLTTILLAAREDIYGVMLGGIIGHSICTGIAVLGGRFVAQRISVRTVTIIGGIVFLIFAISALIFRPLSDG